MKTGMMNTGKLAVYHLMALITITVWGVTFVSTKVLISYGLSPVEIFIIRFTIAYVCTLIFSHDRFLSNNLRDELYLLAAGITGGSLYFIAENSALGITFASNVSLIICCAPIFTIVLGRVFFNDANKRSVWAGSIIAFSGVAIVVLNGSKEFGINPLGDFLTIVAAISWAIYCLILKKLNHRYSNIFITRKVFAYGVITALVYYLLMPSATPFMIKGNSQLLPSHNFLLTDPLQFLLDSNLTFSETKSIIGNLLFLSIGASFICYLMWNVTVAHLGPEKTSNYIYLVPLVTIAASSAILNEPFTLIMALGTALIIGGVILSTK